jgi:hypothetical protein
VYGAAEFEAIKSAPLIKSQLTVGERPKKMMLQTANTEERADSGHSLHHAQRSARRTNCEFAARAPMADFLIDSLGVNMNRCRWRAIL